MTKIKIYMVIIFIVLSVLYVASICEIKDQYDEELVTLKEDLNYYIKELDAKRTDNRMMGYSMEYLIDQLNGKKSIECEHGVYEYEQGYIIDGYYYEYKGEADIQMEE